MIVSAVMCSGVGVGVNSTAGGVTGVAVAAAGIVGEGEGVIVGVDVAVGDAVGEGVRVHVDV